jgi:hypothetical protein
VLSDDLCQLIEHLSQLERSRIGEAQIGLPELANGFEHFCAMPLQEEEHVIPRIQIRTRAFGVGPADVVTCDHGGFSFELQSERATCVVAVRLGIGLNNLSYSRHALCAAAVPNAGRLKTPDISGCFRPVFTPAHFERRCAEARQPKADFQPLG